MRATWRVLLATAIVCLMSASVVHAECPNGCSGNGDCMAKDMCECYKSFQGNDCADRMCLFGRAHVDTPKGDINMDRNRESPTNPLLVNSQQFPVGTYEYFSPDAVAEEAHFYMECSNKGICDRSTGLCQCFDGYEGNGCQRTTCPGKCNGHGTCESLRELGIKAAGTLFGTEGPIGAVTYDLWDSNSTYGCHCDPWYFGPDCNRRNCKVGVDPLFLSAGSATYETFVVHAYVAQGGALTNSWIRLRLFDYYGESYITKKIAITDGLAATATDMEEAIKGVPNQTFRKVKCITVGDATGPTYLKNFKSSAGAVGAIDGSSIVCQYIDNPGKMRIPEIAESNALVNAYVTTTSLQGADDEWFTVKTTSTAAVATTGVTVTTSAAYVQANFPTVPFMVKIGAHVLLVTAFASGTTMTIAYAFPHTLGSATPIMLPQTGVVTATKPVDATPADVTVDAVDVGSDKFKISEKPTNLAVGDMVFFFNSFYTVQRIYEDTDWYIKVDKPFPGKTADGSAVAAAADIYKVTLSADAKSKVYKYVSECSGRGLCGYDTGICTCFKGYTNDNCNTQNILAL